MEPQDIHRPSYIMMQHSTPCKANGAMRENVKVSPLANKDARVKVLNRCRTEMREKRNLSLSKVRHRITSETLDIFSMQQNNELERGENCDSQQQEDYLLSLAECDDGEDSLGCEADYDDYGIDSEDDGGAINQLDNDNFVICPICRSNYVTLDWLDNNMEGEGTAVLKCDCGMQLSCLPAVGNIPDRQLDLGVVRSKIANAYDRCVNV